MNFLHMSGEEDDRHSDNELELARRDDVCSWNAGRDHVYRV
jgi:hypothetical protein